MTVALEKAVVARLNRFGTHYEILVDPEAAEALRARLVSGAKVPDNELRAVLATDIVFTHWSDGKKAAREDLLKGFETDDFVRIATRILVEGEIQLTSDQRRKMGEAKHKRIVETLLRNAWNPQTKSPHPKERIERALEEAKFKVDPLRRTEEQIEQAMKLLRPLLPIAFEKVRVAVRVPAEHTGHAYGPIRSMGDIQKEEWQDDGALILILEIPAGMQTEVYDRLNKLTHGQVTTKLIGPASPPKA
ncbi:MAG TPA: ribosome assembly factor SBDS [Candidatus Thermoplasmatota archaeon]|nr:ribosome assembly factor SBDS [Candidatus Thermoplasmatota archaeon]